MGTSQKFERISYRSLIILLVILFSIFCSVAFAYTTGDDYPSEYKNLTKDAVVDRWNFYNRECTSFVAWCLNSRNNIAFTNQYGGVSRWGHAKTWGTVAQQLGITVNSTPAVGAVAWSSAGTYGHVAWVSEVNGNSITIEEYNYAVDGGFGRRTISSSDVNGFIHIADINPEIRGSEMSQGFDRMLPDGDYLIATAGASKSTFYYLDISGADKPAASETNVNLWSLGEDTSSIPECDIWTVTYNTSDKFYTIKQKGTDICLDVYYADTLQGTNIQVCASNGGPAQKWAIERNGSNGYRLRPKCSGAGDNAMCLDIYNGTMASGTNVQQWKINNSDAQSWMFIPYNPSQPIDDGRYMLLYTANKSYEVDVPGNTGNIDNNTKIQLWTTDTENQYNSFDFTKLSNGYYKIKHAASGKCLDVTDGLSNYKANVALHDDNGSLAQQWAVIENGSGYRIVSRCNGYSLDLPNGTTETSANVEVYPWVDNNHQTWSFVQAEHTVRYDLNGGISGPDSQVKYYNNPLSISTVVPTRSGYKFVKWTNGTTDYQPGDTYNTDANLTLHAVWESLTYTITYDANGGTGKPDGESYTVTGSTTLSTDVPNREGHDFLGWATTSTATSATYQPGDTYPGREATLFAVWKIKEFKVTFDSDGADSYEDRHVEWGNTVGDLPSPIKSGYFFKGWFAGNSKVTADTVVKSDLNLIARWQAPSTMTLPSALTEIEDEAFEGFDTNCIIIPGKVTSIGSKAFANNSGLYTAIVYSRTVSPASDAFANCPNLTIVGYADTPIQYYALAKNIPFVAIGSTSDWVLDTDMPVGASTVDNKWTYTQTTGETTTSTESSLSGWTQTGWSWKQTGTGTWKYASYPSGFDTGNNLYSKYNKSALAAGESVTGNTKRVVDSGSSFVTYIYWHWTFVDSLNSSNDNSNVLVEDAKKYNVLTGNVYRDYIYFDAFEDTVDHGTWGPGSSGQINVDPMRYAWRDNLGDVSHWWWIFEVRQQTYTDYQKQFSYVKNGTTEMESSTDPSGQDDVSNVQHWVKYQF